MADDPTKYLNEPGLRLYDTLLKQYVDNKAAVFCDTTAGWNAQPTLIGKAGCIYIYSDYKQNSQNQDIAGIKVGDGQAYLIDAPFIEEILYSHITDNVAHITAAERTSWDGKVRCYIDPNDNQNLVFTTN